MTSINNSEFNTYLNQAQSLLGQLGSLGGVSGNASSYVNSIFNGINSVEQIASDDDSQKAAGIQNLINSVMSVIDKLISNEAQAAKRDVKNNSKRAAEIEKEQKAAEAELKNQISEISNEVKGQSDIVVSASNLLKKTSEELQAKQVQINEIIKQIQEKQEELASAKTAKERASLLNEIQGLSNSIVKITSAMADIQATVEDESSKVEAAVTQIETAKGNAVEIQQDGQMKITEIAQDGAAEIQNNVQSNATGVSNEVTGASAQAAAEAASSNYLTASTAPKLYRVANDQNTAGSTRIGGAVQNLRTVMQGIGGLSNNTEILAHFETSIGSKLNEFSGYVGAWNSALEPVITSIGSFVGEAGVQATNEVLQKAVKTDLETVTNTESNDGNKNPEGQPNLLTPNVKFQEFGI